MTDGDATHTDLYRKIAAFDIDGGSHALSFADRLARENGWSSDFAARVIAEYKRFLYLLVVDGHPVTPSDQVDQAWHLHLTYTRSYWDRLCGEIVGRPLHHMPTEGGGAEADKFDRWYRRTLDTYERLFGCPPPSDIWPPPDTRFADDVHFRRVNTQRHWVLPRPPQTLHRLSAVASGIWVVALLPALAILVSSTSGLAWTGESLPLDIDVMVLAAVGLMLAVAITVRSLFGMPRCPNCGALWPELLDRRVTQTGFLAKDYRCKRCARRFSRVLDASDERKGNGSGCGGSCGGDSGCGGE